MISEVTNECNMQMMARYPDGFFDLAIIDPPYRDENQPTADMRKNGSMETIKGRPTELYFNELKRVTKEQIIWGANNFQLPQFKGFIVWKKKTITEEFTMSMCEIASLSEGLGTVSKWIEIAPQGNILDPRIHPNQKPIQLYRWQLQKYAKIGFKILDTHMGSQSLRIACQIEGFDFYGCELDPDYFKEGCKRYENHILQQRLF